MKNRVLPSADTVGLNSARSELILIPKFSILSIVEAVIILSFWGFNKVSLEGWALALYAHARVIRKGVSLFTKLGLLPK